MLGDNDYEDKQGVVSATAADDSEPEEAQDQVDSDAQDDVDPDAQDVEDEPPSLEAVVERIAALSEDRRRFLRQALGGKRGQGTHKELSSSLGISPAALSARIGTLFRKYLGAGAFRGRKNFLRKALAAYDAQQSMPTGSRSSARPDGHARPDGSATAVEVIGDLPEEIGNHLQRHAPTVAEQVPMSHPSMIQGASGHGTLMVHLPPGVRRVTIEFD